MQMDALPLLQQLQLFIITDPAEFLVSGSVSSNFNGEDISCFGASDGEVTLTLFRWYWKC